MSASFQPSSSLAPAAGVPVMGWHLGARRTVSLLPKANGVLRIAQGRVWVTMGALQGLAGQPDSGDVVLHAGEELAVPAGAHLVMECWPVQPGDAVRFDWTERVVAQPAVVPRFQREVAIPVRDLGHELRVSAGALGRAGWAFARVVWGLAGYADHLVAGRGRVMSSLEAGQP